jgi:hypothetical protein
MCSSGICTGGDAGAPLTDGGTTKPDAGGQPPDAGVVDSGSPDSGLSDGNIGVPRTDGSAGVGGSAGASNKSDAGASGGASGGHPKADASTNGETFSVDRQGCTCRAAGGSRRGTGALTLVTALIVAGAVSRRRRGRAIAARRADVR